MASRNLIAIDLGTSALKALAARETGEAGFEILAKVYLPHFGIAIRRGEVTNPQELVNSLAPLIEEIQKKAKIKPKHCLVNVNGPRLFSAFSEGVVSVSRADQKISENDIERVLQQAQAINLPPNKEVLDVFPKEFIIDEEGGVKHPLDLEGMRLKVRALLICAFSPVLESLFKAISESNLEIKDVIPSALASSWSCLKEQEREVGVCLLDIGAATCGLTVFEEGNLIDFAVFPFGSSHITNDIAIGLRTKIETAERIKKEFGFVSSGKKRKKRGKESRDKIELPEKSLVFSKKILQDIIEERVSEVFGQVAAELKRISKHQLLPSGVVLTGGGSLLPGLAEFAREELKLPIRLGRPEGIVGLEADPVFSTCAGLLLSCKENRKRSGGGGEPSEGFKTKLRKLFKMFLP